MKAYNNINGKFINVSTVAENENRIVENKDVRVNILSEIEKSKKNKGNHEKLPSYIKSPKEKDNMNKTSKDILLTNFFTGNNKK